ncbi:MAG TPA: EAL domain-containing protein [Thermoanaerobaculia bacterium]|nr:EAL domain-containing protein [Thermoanaerobaculia bacterium]
MNLARESQDLLELKAAWLKLRGRLYDSTTNLPTLAAVLEKIRRQVEAGERVGLVYIETSSEGQLERLVGWQAYDRLIGSVGQALLDLRGSALPLDATIALAGVRSDEFVIFVSDQVSEGLNRHGLETIENQVVAKVREQLSPFVRSELPGDLFLLPGCAMLENEPTVRIERSIYKVLAEVQLRCHEKRQRQHRARSAELGRLLAASDLHVTYQPIVRLEDGSVHGFEALSSGPSGGVFESPEVLFAFAEETQSITHLERLCRERALAGFQVAATDRRLFVNSSSYGVADPEIRSGSFRRRLAAAGLEAKDVVFELTERVAITEWLSFRQVLDELREMGFRIAIDDVGAGYSSLQSIAEIEPDYLKFDLSLVRDLHASKIKRDLLSALGDLAAKIGATVIAEGIEHEQEFHTLREMGVTLGQGFLLSPPLKQPLADRVEVPTRPAGGVWETERRAKP